MYGVVKLIRKNGFGPVPPVNASAGIVSGPDSTVTASGPMLSEIVVLSAPSGLSDWLNCRSKVATSSGAAGPVSEPGATRNPNAVIADPDATPASCDAAKSH